MKKTIFKSFTFNFKLFKRKIYFTFFIERDWYDACFSLLRIDIWRIAGETVYPIQIGFEYFSLGFSVYAYEYERIDKFYEEIPF